MWAGFFSRQDVSISIFGRTKEFSEVRGTSLMCNFGVRSRFLDVIYGVRPPNGSPEIWYGNLSNMVWKHVKYGMETIQIMYRNFQICYETCQVKYGNLSNMEWIPVKYGKGTCLIWYGNLSNMVWKPFKYGMATVKNTMETCLIWYGNLSNMVWKLVKYSMETC